MANCCTLPMIHFEYPSARKQFDNLICSGVAIDKIQFYTTWGISFKFNTETSKFEVIKDESSKIEQVKYKAYASYMPLTFDGNDFRRLFSVRFTKEMS